MTPVRVEMTSVLIVNSYPDEGEMYAEYLQAFGAAVRYVGAPEQALPLLESRPPAVIVTDMVFPGSEYDGVAFLQAVRALPACATTNCIMVSGYTSMKDRERARAAGVDLFLVKPCAPDDLRRHIERAASTHPPTPRAEWSRREGGTCLPD